MKLAAETSGLVIEAPACGRARDYGALLKPRLVALVLMTTVAGFVLGYVGPLDTAALAMLAQTVLGTALTAGGTMALNQYLERDTDGLMHRTRHRPLPDHRLGPGQALRFGLLLVCLGTGYLTLAVNALAGGLAVLAAAGYLLVYTPMKTRTPICTLVGAVPGAIPPVIGYAAASGSLNMEVWTLFTILYVWQIPHFLSIAYVHREDYARGEQMMLPVVEVEGRRTAERILFAVLALLAATTVPTLIGMAGAVYFCGALGLGIVFAYCCFAFAAGREREQARRVFFVSVLYLPLLLGLMVIDHFPA